MAMRENQPSRLRVSVQTGLASNGTPVLRHRTYNRMNDALTDASVLTIGNALGSLQKHPVVYIHRIDEARVLPL